MTLIYLNDSYKKTFPPATQLKETKKVCSIASIMKKNEWTNAKICAKVAFPRYTESVKFSKAEKQLQNENHTEDWALGSHPRDNGHVTH